MNPYRTAPEMEQEPRFVRGRWGRVKRSLFRRWIKTVRAKREFDFKVFAVAAAIESVQQMMRMYDKDS